ncbi:MAG: hypothetical protein ACE5FU_06340 [Nitrospinota bacterium]
MKKKTGQGRNFPREVVSVKYKQAAFVYGLNSVVFIAMFGGKAPFHDFGLWSVALFTVGIVLMGLFTVLIYRGYRKVVLALACVCAVRLVVTVLKIPFFTYIISFVLFLQALTCCMLTRAALENKNVKRTT